MDNYFEGRSIALNIGGPKERKNGDKSFHGLMVALAMAGTIAGSAILFAYAASDGATPDTETQAAPSQEPEPKVIEKVVEKPVYIEKVTYINQTVEVEKPVYINRTIEVPVYIEKEVEKPVYIDRPVYVNEPKDEEEAPIAEEPSKESEIEELPDDELELIPESLRELLDDIGDFDEDDDDNGKKGKDRGKD